MYAKQYLQSEEQSISDFTQALYLHRVQFPLHACVTNKEAKHRIQNSVQNSIPMCEASFFFLLWGTPFVCVLWRVVSALCYCEYPEYQNSFFLIVSLKKMLHYHQCCIHECTWVKMNRCGLMWNFALQMLPYLKSPRVRVWSGAPLEREERWVCPLSLPGGAAWRGWRSRRNSPTTIILRSVPLWGQLFPPLLEFMGPSGQVCAVSRDLSSFNWSFTRWLLRF